MVEILAKLNIAPHTEKLLRFPEKWDDLTASELLYIASKWPVWKELVKLQDNLHDAKADVILHICGAKNARERRMIARILSFINEQTGISILEYCDFIFNRVSLKKNLLPVLKVRPYILSGSSWHQVRVRTHYHGPADRLKDISIDEFSFAFGCYSLYHQTGQEKYIDSLVAALYRPANPHFGNPMHKHGGERRVPFNNTLMSVYEKRIRRLSMAHKWAVYLFFEGVLEHLKGKYPLIFRRAESNAGGGGSFTDTIVELSGAGFGNFNETKKQDMHLILNDLHKKIRKQLER